MIKPSDACYPADRVVVPVQDVLGLGSSARMNTPGEPEGNWAWRLPPPPFRPEHAQRLRRLAHLAGRLHEGGRQHQDGGE